MISISSIIIVAAVLLLVGPKKMQQVVIAALLLYCFPGLGAIGLAIAAATYLTIFIYTRK